MNERDFDVVLWGASGFTGALVAEYIANKQAGAAPQRGLRWGIAGRSQTKLETLRSQLARIDKQLEDLPILIADSNDSASLESLSQKTKVVCSTVGPFARYGSNLVAACVASGTHYCDITGEAHWIRKMVDSHHEAANEKRLRIVNCCGFDSIPSDLGTWILQEHFIRQHGSPAQEVRAFYGPVKGGPSGGTIATMLNMLEQAKTDPSIRKVLGHPYGLNPSGEKRGPDGPDQTGIRSEESGYTAPFVMAGINTRIVRRSNAVMNYRYGRDFSYSEVMRFRRSPKGLLSAVQLVAGLGGLMAGLAIPATRKLLSKHVLPKPGEGPSKAQREAGFFVLQLRGRGKDQSGRSVETHATVKGINDPGYGETAKMLGESAICLACDSLGNNDHSYGIVTPASALGGALVKRLVAAKMTFRAEG